MKKLLAFASIQTAVDIYGHLETGSNRHALNRLDGEGDFASTGRFGGSVIFRCAMRNSKADRCS